MKTKGKAKGQKGKTKDPFPVDWMSKGKGRQKGKFKTQTGPKGRRYTAEEASLLDTDANENQWSDLLDASQYDTWQAECFTLDWNGHADWDEVDDHYQDWATFTGVAIQNKCARCITSGIVT